MKEAYFRNDDGTIEPKGVFATRKGSETVYTTQNGHPLRTTDVVTQLKGWKHDKARIYEITEMGIKIGEMLVPE